MSKIIIIVVGVVIILAVLIVGGFLVFRNVANEAYKAPIKDNANGKMLLAGRIAKAKIRLEQIDPLLQKYYPTVLNKGLYLLDDISAKVDWKRPLDADGTVSVTVIKSARGFYAYPENDLEYPFIKMHAEQSMQQNFEKDKQAIIKFLKDMSSTPDSHLEKMEIGTYEGIEYYSVDSDATKTTGVKGITEIFFPKDQMIVTIYFLTQPPETGSYKTQEEYKALKTEFIQEIIDYVNKSNS